MTARVLLDTHLLLWMLGVPGRLSKAARARIDGSDVLVSAASIWEISIKASLGKIEADAKAVLRAVEPAGFTLLPITGEHAAAVSDLPAHHRDSIDRLLIAQAIVEGTPLLTNDTTLLAYGRLIELI
jgi:PIN domain nuclease of toxin-antitoxin system